MEGVARMIKGEKVYLCAVDPSNWEQLRQWRNMPELRAGFREYRELTVGTQKDYWQSVEHDRSQCHFEVWIKRYKDTLTGINMCEQLIGYCGLTHISWTNRSAEFGIYIAPEFQGKGYGYDALKTLLNYGFYELNLNRIYAEVYGNNTHALEVYHTIGFRTEGTMREHYYHDGQYWDSFIIGMLRRDWEK